MTRICAQLLAAFLASILIAPTCFGGPVYRVVDAQGNITYTDAPEAGKRKEEIEVPQVNLQPALTPTPNPTPAPANTIQYQARILSPVNDSTIPPGQLSVAVAVELKPALQQRHRVRVMLDGKAQGKPATATAFQLSNLVRGTHQIIAEVIDTDNQVVAATAAVAIHVKRHSVNHPNAVQAPVSPAKKP